MGSGHPQVFYPSSNRNYRMTCSSLVIPISSDEECGKRTERTEPQDSGFRIELAMTGLQRSQNLSDESFPDEVRAVDAAQRQHFMHDSSSTAFFQMAPSDLK